MIAAPALASHPYPPYDPAYFNPGALPPVLDLAPGGYPFTQALDGQVHPVEEYADGKVAQLQDWYTGRPDGDMSLALTGQHLTVGMRIEPGKCSAPDGCLFVFGLDEDRAATLATPTKPPGAEDRWIAVWFQDPTQVTVAHASGTSGWGLGAQEQYATAVAVRMHPDGQYHLEVNIELQKRSAPHTETKRGAEFGLAVAVSGAGPCSDSYRFMSPLGDCDHPSFYLWPNEPYATGGQWIAHGNYPYTWATVRPRMPSAPATGFMSYNAGQMPDFLGNQGDGTPNDFASFAGQPELQAVCLQEIWKHNERAEIVALAEVLGALAVGAPQWADGNSDLEHEADLATLDMFSSGFAVQDTGLLLLVRGAIAKSEVVEFGDDRTGCEGSDCLEDKGFIWARLALANGKKTRCHQERDYTQPCVNYASTSVCPKKQVCSDDVISGEDVMDVYCTHLQASCDSIAAVADIYDTFVQVMGDVGLAAAYAVGFDFGVMEDESCYDSDVRNVQLKQLEVLREHMTNHVLKDRPSIVMGDFNRNGRDVVDLQKTPAKSDYGRFASLLGALDRTRFETVTSLYSGRHDLGLGFWDAAAGVYPVTGTKPVFAEQVFAEAKKHSDPLPPRLFGEGTNIGDSDNQESDHTNYPPAGNPERNRYDYIWIVPADTGAELPVFAPLGEPNVTVDAYFYSNGRALSDHRAVTAKIEFARLKDPLGYNPMKAHTLTYGITHIQSLEGDGGDCDGGQDWLGEGFQWVNGSETASPSWDGADDSDTLSPGWTMSTGLTKSETAKWQFWVDEDDTWACGGDDNFDITAWSGRDAVSDFEHLSSLWRFRDDGAKVQKAVCFSGLVAGCDVVGGMSTLYNTQGTWDASAAVTHELVAVQQ